MNAIVRILFECWVVVGAATSGAARQDDISAIERRVNALSAAGNYTGALVEAQKLEAADKAWVGTNHPSYGLALTKLGRAYYSYLLSPVFLTVLCISTKKDFDTEQRG